MLTTFPANTQGLTIALLFKNPMMYAGHQRGRIQVIKNYLVHTCLRVGNRTPGEPPITGSPRKPSGLTAYIPVCLRPKTLLRYMYASRLV